MPLRGEHRDVPTYEAIETLEDGAAGVLVHAHDNVRDVPVLQKTVEHVGREDAVAFTEPWLLERLEHPQIPRVHFAQHDPDFTDAVTFVMDWFEEGSVERALLEGRCFSLHEAITVMRDVLSALSYLHTQWALLHRDVKPGNILLGGGGKRGFLIDFGSAARLGDDGLVEATGGTPVYQPPEAQTGRFGAPGEVYAASLTLYEMLNGRLPYESLDFAEVDRRLGRGYRAVPDRLLTSFEPHVPRKLRRVVNRGMRRDVAHRYQRARELSELLGQARCIDWRRVGGVGPVGEWEGTWPAHKHLDRRTTYRVQSRLLQSGHQSGNIRLTATYEAPETARRRRLSSFSDVTVDSDDMAGIEKFFEDLAAKVAQREPVR